MGYTGKKLYIVIGCDTDPDRPGYIDNISLEKLSWRGLSEGIPETKETVKNVKDADDRSPVFTWLIRADEQIKSIYGDYSWVLAEYKQFLTDLEASGDEIGWHPHFYRFNDDHEIWYQELDNIDWQCEMLESAFGSFNQVFPGRPLSVRMGWVYHNNETMKKLDELGIKIDFSAVPGMRTISKKTMKFPYNIYDWFITPKGFYHPSASDYRRAAKKGENELSILEAPNFTSNSFIWGVIAGLQMARKMKDPVQMIQAIRKPTFWVNLTGNPRLFAPIIKTLEGKLERSEKKPIFFIAYFHPDELIENKSTIYSRDNLRQNLIKIYDTCQKLEVPFEFIRAESIPDIIGG